jgi:hypothetical protein
MAMENPAWGYTRTKGRNNLGHEVARSTVATVLQAHGIPADTGPADLLADVPAGHWGAIAGADFFTTEVRTPRGLITYYTLHQHLCLLLSPSPRQH